MEQELKLREILKDIFSEPAIELMIEYYKKLYLEQYQEHFGRMDFWPDIYEEDFYDL